MSERITLAKLRRVSRTIERMRKRGTLREKSFIEWLKEGIVSSNTTSPNPTPNAVRSPPGSHD